MSKRGTMTALLALFEVVDEEELEDPLEPVPVGVEVTVPVPAVPAWLNKLEHVLAVELVCVFALPEKSQAELALLWLL